MFFVEIPARYYISNNFDGKHDENDDNPLFIGFGGTRFSDKYHILYIDDGSMMDGVETLCGNVALQTLD